MRLSSRSVLCFLDWTSVEEKHPACVCVRACVSVCECVCVGRGCVCVCVVMCLFLQECMCNELKSRCVQQKKALCKYFSVQPLFNAEDYDYTFLCDGLSCRAEVLLNLFFCERECAMFLQKSFMFVCVYVFVISFLIVILFGCLGEIWALNV